MPGDDLIRHLGTSLDRNLVTRITGMENLVRRYRRRKIGGKDNIGQSKVVLSHNYTLFCASVATIVRHL